MNNEDFHKKRLRNKGALIGAGIGAIAGGAGNYFRKDKDKRSAKDALIGAAGGAGVGGLAGGATGYGIGHRDKISQDKLRKDIRTSKSEEELNQVKTDYAANNVGAIKRLKKSIDALHEINEAKKGKK